MTPQRLVQRDAVRPDLRVATCKLLCAENLFSPVLASYSVAWHVYVRGDFTEAVVQRDTVRPEFARCSIVVA
eukprot:592981-Pelagomonas_calceolata.AAC.4